MGLLFSDCWEGFIMSQVYCVLEVFAVVCS